MSDHTPLFSFPSLKDWSLSATLAGILASTMGYAGPLVILFQVAESSNLNDTVLSSWIWGMSIASGLLCGWFSLRYRMPLLFAWNAPGSALLVTLVPGIPWSDVIGAYIMSGSILLFLGVTGLFERLVNRLPLTLAAALLAGILVNFSLALFSEMTQSPLLGLVMFSAYIILRHLLPRYAIMLTIAVGVGVLAIIYDLSFHQVEWQISTPHWYMPSFSLTALFSISLPLMLVAVSGQFIAGIAILRQDKYLPPSNQIVAGSGLMSILFAPTACHGVNLSAITAAICTGSDANYDSKKRYIGPVVAMLCYFIFGIFSAALVSVVQAFPTVFIAMVAGIALLGALEGSLSQALSQPAEREAALCTFLITASDLMLLGLSSAFWGLVIGGSIIFVQRYLTK
ncbi:MAG: benzoate membrane transport protein [Reinekea sp.]|jgi:benzoate membrane transport protein|uniref:benzoate/H(+) symporter BenE family transporter n=1 Tax=Gammaproteobacteria TaxID=1236 RepID=UPI00241F73F1|nr:benzoate/H(+) symporter BenE family transporter [Alteromonas mediterranea]|tara:strand:+ start:6714 stop:7907 length:1194 start_codon:yes stop_codon:yes gene_type:complete